MAKRKNVPAPAQHTKTAVIRFRDGHETFVAFDGKYGYQDVRKWYPSAMSIRITTVSVA